jgi:hypothetical protein
MSETGQKRRFDPLPVTSGLPRSTDIIRPARHVRLVPEADLTVPGYFARLNTTSSVVLGNKPGLVNFNSLSVSEVMVRFSRSEKRAR